MHNFHEAYIGGSDGKSAGNPFPRFRYPPKCENLCKTVDKPISPCYNKMYPRPHEMADVIQEEVFSMAKVSEAYETMAVYSLKNGEDGVKALNDKFKALIEKNGTLESADEWGKRKLAYEIDDQTEGYYVLYTFTSKPDFPAELDRVFKITDGVMRSLTTVR